MLSACAKYKTRNNVFSRHWNYEYGIENPQYILDMLCEKGFIEPDDVFATINNFKASELKQELSALNLKVSGKKADLVDRLINAMDKASLDTIYPDRYYRLTSLGKLELEENNYLKYTTYGLNKWELNRLIAKGKHSCQEIVWNYLMKECNYYAKRYEMGMYRNSKCTVYRFLMQEQRTQEAFNTLAEIVYYDLSMSSNGDKKYYQEGAFSWILPSLTYITPYERSLYRSGMITEFTKLQQIMMLSDEDLKAKLKTAFEQFNIPAVLVLFTVDECAEIVIASLHKDTSYLNTVYEKAAIRKTAEYETVKNNRNKR